MIASQQFSRWPVPPQYNQASIMRKMRAQATAADHEAGVQLATARAAHIDSAKAFRSSATGIFFTSATDLPSSSQVYWLM